MTVRGGLGLSVAWPPADEGPTLGAPWSGRSGNVSPVPNTFSFQGHVRAGEILYHIPLLLAGRTGNPLSGRSHWHVGCSFLDM